MSYDPSFHPDLERGVVGEPVARLQSLLSSLGYYLSIDGDFGLGTERSVVELQTSNGLMPTGKVNRDTWELLLSMKDREDEVKDINNKMNKNQKEITEYEVRLSQYIIEEAISKNVA